MKNSKALLIGFIGALCVASWGIAAVRNTPEEKKEVFKTIRGGGNHEAAVPIEPNRDYKLNHHQKKGEFDYFILNIPPDSDMTVEVRTFEKGLSWNNGRKVVTTEPFASLQLEDSKKTMIRTLEIVTPHSADRMSVRNRSGKEQTYYLAVGSSKNSLNKDHVAFKASLAPFHAGDLGTQEDAGSTPNAAMPIAPSHAYTENLIGGDDSKDVYSFPASKKEWYTIVLRAEDPIQPNLRVTVLTPKQKKLLSYESGGADEVITKSFKIPKDGEYFVEVSLSNPVQEKSLYSIEVDKVAGPKQ